MPRKTLFVTHVANRSGASLALLHLLKWIKKNSDYQFDILFQLGGPLVDDFSNTADRSFFFQEYSFFPKVVKRIAGRNLASEWNRALLKQQLERNKYDLIYANSVASNFALEKLDLSYPILTQVREMKYAFDVLGISPSSYILKNTTHFIAVTKAIARNLTNNFNVKPEDIDIISTYTPVRLLRGRHEKTGTVTIGSAGTVEWRKGADLFIQLAKIFTSAYPDIDVKFIWVGGFESKQLEYQIKYDISMLDLQDVVEFVGESKTPLDYFRNFDVFALMSREEGLGLVCIENMQFGIPVVCFDRVGGIVEYAEKGAAIKVPYLDLAKMAFAIHSLLSDQELVTNVTDKAYQEIRSTFDIDKIGKKTLQLIDKTISQ